MDPWMILAYGLSVLLVVVVWILAFLVFIRHLRKEKAMKELEIDHISMYFDDYFPTIIKNFDLVKKSKFDTWSASIGKRLNTVGDNISTIQTFKKGFDPRLKTLEKQVDALEKSSS